MASSNLLAIKSSSNSDLTPKPLRVAKGHSIVSSNGNESFVTAIEERSSGVLQRSASNASCQPLVAGSTLAPSWPSSRVDDQDLHVLKKRRNQASSNPRTRDSSSSRLNSQLVLLDLLGRSRAESEAETTSIGFRKAVRNGVLSHRLSRKLMTPVSNFVSAGASHDRRVQSENIRPVKIRKSAQDTHEAKLARRINIQSEDHPNQLPLRRLSLKDRFLKRSISGSIPRAASVYQVKENEWLSGSVSFDRSDHAAEETKKPSIHSLDKNSESARIPPSTGKEPLLLNPTAHDRFVGPIPSMKKLSKPSDAGMLAGQISFTPEFESVSFEKGESMLALAQFEAQPSSLGTSDIAGPPVSGLDVMLIIDNSYRSSPATLMSHCETARYIASALLRENDRIGIVCIASDTTCSNNVMRLGRFDAKRFKVAIDSIGPCCDGMQVTTFASSLELAQRTLLDQERSQSSGSDYATELPVYGHIFVLAHRIDDTWDDFTVDPTLTLSIICGETLPTKPIDMPFTNGWRIRSLLGDYPQPLSRTGPRYQHSDVAGKIDRLLSQARKGCRLGTLNNVEWELSSCKDTTIEKVWGADRIERMQPGEVSTLIIQIRCKVPKAANAFLTGNVGDNKDMFRELERLFAGLDGTPLLRAAVSYSHSSLPNDTVCASMGTCYAKPYISSPGTSTYVLRPKSALFSSHRIAVHKCLTLHCFAMYGADKAVQMLKQYLGEGSNQIACGKFVATLVNQQRYHSIQKARRSLSGGIWSARRSSAGSESDSAKLPSNVSPGKRSRAVSSSSGSSTANAGPSARSSSSRQVG